MGKVFPQALLGRAAVRVAFDDKTFFQQTVIKRRSVIAFSFNKNEFCFHILTAGQRAKDFIKPFFVNLCKYPVKIPSRDKNYDPGGVIPQ